MDDFQFNMMINFLKRNYPVIRVKDKNRFKRAIVLDNGSTCFLSNEISHINLKNQLIHVLKTVFHCDENTSITVLKEFLNL